MGEPELRVTIRVENDEAGPERLVEYALSLRREIGELDVESVRFAPGGAPPPGTRGDPSALTPVLVAVVSSPVLAELLRLLQSWVTRDRTIELTGPGGAIKLTRPSSQEQHALVEAWLAATTTARNEDPVQREKEA
jgi:hypothetical protein